MVTAAGSRKSACTAMAPCCNKLLTCVKFLPIRWTVCPFSSRACARCCPRNPVPPVRRIFIGSFETPPTAAGKGGELGRSPKPQSNPHPDRHKAPTTTSPRYYLSPRQGAVPTHDLPLAKKTYPCKLPLASPLPF